MSSNPYAFGLGIGTLNKKGDWLEVYFPNPILNPSVKVFSVFKPHLHSGKSLNNNQVVFPNPPAK